uniref:Uncharacterized protein n=1 Tax=Anguilla anguilla TaxID=7936 RepID=A0A0E9VXV4_ANGAN
MRENRSQNIQHQDMGSGPAKLQNSLILNGILNGNIHFLRREYSI